MSRSRKWYDCGQSPSPETGRLYILPRGLVMEGACKWSGATEQRLAPTFCSTLDGRSLMGGGAGNE